MDGFIDRADGGRQLARLLQHYAGRPGALVLALPRGGVPVGYEVARALGLPFDIFLVRKLGVPGREELAMGAIASADVLVPNREVMELLRIPPQVLEAVAAKERAELHRREREYRQGRPAPDVRGRTVILVDDGLATGSSMRAAVAALRRQGAARIVVAVPVGSPETCAELRREVDEAVCALEPDYFIAVGEWYRDFSQTGDRQVRDLLARAEEEYAGYAR